MRLTLAGRKPLKSDHQEDAQSRALPPRRAAARLPAAASAYAPLPLHACDTRLPPSSAPRTHCSAAPATCHVRAPYAPSRAPAQVWDQKLRWKGTFHELTDELKLACHDGEKGRRKLDDVMGEAALPLAELPWAAQPVHEMTTPPACRGPSAHGLLPRPSRLPHRRHRSHDLSTSDTAPSAVAAATTAVSTAAGPSGCGAPVPASAAALVASSSSAGASVPKVRGGGAKAKPKPPSKELRREVLDAAGERVGKGAPLSAGKLAPRAPPAGRPAAACARSESTKEGKEASEGAEMVPICVALEAAQAAARAKRSSTGLAPAVAHAPAALEAGVERPPLRRREVTALEDAQQQPVLSCMVDPLAGTEGALTGVVGAAAMPAVAAGPLRAPWGGCASVAPFAQPCEPWDTSIGGLFSKPMVHQAARHAPAAAPAAAHAHPPTPPPPPPTRRARRTRRPPPPPPRRPRRARRARACCCTRASADPAAAAAVAPAAAPEARQGSICGAPVRLRDLELPAEAAAAPAPLTPRSSPAFLLGVTLDKKGRCMPRDTPPRPRPGHAGLQLQLARGPRPAAGAARHGEGAPSAQRKP